MRNHAWPVGHGPFEASPVVGHEDIRSMGLQIFSKSPPVTESVRLFREHVRKGDVQAVPETLPALIPSIHCENDVTVLRQEAVREAAEANLRPPDAESRKCVQQGPMARHFPAWAQIARLRNVSSSRTGCHPKSRSTSLQSNSALRPREIKSRKDGGGTSLPIARLMTHLPSSSQ